MIAAISPTSYCYEDTHNTLTYANRAMGIQFNYKPSTLTIDSNNQSSTIEALRNEIKLLKKENERLKLELMAERESKTCTTFTRQLNVPNYFDRG